MEDSDSLSFNQIQDNSDDLGALEDTDVCVVCCEGLENSLLLSCLHSICRSCASSQTNDHIKCPRCRTISSVASLTSDFFNSTEPPRPSSTDNSALIRELTESMGEGREKIETCNDSINKLTNHLGELHEERENIKNKIEETFLLYKSLLEECRDQSLLQLENAHNDKELATMDRLEDLSHSQSNLDHTISYISKVIKEFPNTEAMDILPKAKAQLLTNLSQVDSLCKVEPENALTWQSDQKQFKRLLAGGFGSLVDGSNSSPSISVSVENLVIPELAQRNVIGPKTGFSKAITNANQGRKLSGPDLLTAMGGDKDILSPMGGDQGFVSPGESLMSPAGENMGVLDHQGIMNMVKPSPTCLQVPGFTSHQNSLSVTINRPTNTRPIGPIIGSNHPSPAHQGYNTSGRLGLGNSHPDLFRGHTPPPFGRGHTPPILGRGHTPPLVGGRGLTPPLLGHELNPPAAAAARNEYSLAQLAEKIQRSNSGPVHNFTLADLISNVGEDDPSAPSHAYSNLAALAKLDEMQDPGVGGGGGWSVDHNLLLPDLDRGGLSRSMSALTSGQLSPVPPPPMSPLVGLGVPPGLDHHRGASPISPIDGMMGGLSVSPVPPPVRGNRAINVMQVRCKFGTLGPGKGQFNSPHGFCLGQEEEIVVADTNNHRIQIFEKNGTYRNQFGLPGKEEGQLWYPRKVAVMKSSGKFVICDRGNERSRMQIFTKHGHFVRKIAIRYIDIVAGLAITRDGNIVAVDSVTPTMFIISENGDLIRWFDCADYMREPSDIAVSGSEIFVCDFKGHTVVVFTEDGQYQRRIGYENITNFPNGIDVSDAGDVLIGDSHGNRFHVAVFGGDGPLLAEFECPHVKVSRCCGLKITSEGYVVTLAKNNHHVLVLNTLYIA